VTVLGRASEIAAAHALLARAAAADNDHCVVQQHTAAMRKTLGAADLVLGADPGENVLESDDEPPVAAAEARRDDPRK
jgi:hypothetical protein